MDWTNAVVAAVGAQRRAVYERAVSPEAMKVFRSLRGMFEMEEAYAAEELRQGERLMNRLSPSDFATAGRVLAFIAWSIHPTHFDMAPSVEHFDLRGVADQDLMLKLVAEAESATSYTVKVLLPRLPLEELVYQYAQLREYGNADLFILFGAEERATLSVRPRGNGKIHFAHEIPKVDKAALTHICPKCSKRNKPDAARCFGCKRLL